MINYQYTCAKLSVLKEIINEDNSKLSVLKKNYKLEIDKTMLKINC